MTTDEKTGVFGLRAQTSPEECVHALVEEQVRSTPRRIAIEYGQTSYSYEELDTWAERLAIDLQRHGAAPEMVVGLLADTSPAAIAAILAILKTGAVVMPLDPRHPEDRIRFILGEADARLVLVADGLTAPTWHPPALRLRPAPPKTPGLASHHETRAAIRSHNLAYILFTSGSTGRPKGVAMPHSPLVNLIRAALERYPAPARTSQFAPLAFDAAFQEILFTLAGGGTLVLVPPAIRADGMRLAQLLIRADVERIFMPCVALNELANACAELRVQLPVREVFTAGEVLRISPAIERLFTQTGARLENQYGPTETHVTTWEALTGAPSSWPRLPSIGRAIPRAHCYVVDSQLRLVPRGEVGELYLGGAALARGYKNRPTLTAERFIPDAFSGSPGARLYATGDMVRELQDGSLEFAGRADTQVKIRGQRVELGEIEQVLATHPGIADCAVVAPADDNGSRRLIAYVVVRPQHPSHADLRAHLATHLPDVMLPTSYRVVERLPRTSSGKLDRRTLESTECRQLPGAALQPHKGSDIAEIPWALQVTCDAMRTVLGLDSVDQQSSFFELGGDSITAVRVVAALRRAGLPASIAVVYESRTPLNLATRLTRIAEGTPDPAAVAVQPEPFSLLSQGDRRWVPADAEDACPTTRLQRGMLLHNIVDGERVYHDVVSYTLDGVLDEEPLRAAVQLVVNTHQALRTSFVIDGPSEPLQVIHPSARPEVAFFDVRAIATEHRHDDIERWAWIEWNRPFDIAAPAMFRLFIHRTGEHESLLTLSFHHAVLDGWSMASLITEILANYNAIRDGNGPRPTRKDTSLQRYLALEKAAEKSEVHRAFWRNYLDEAEPTELRRLGVPHTDDPSVIETTFMVPRDCASEFRRLARAVGVPLRTAYLAAHLALLSFVSGRPEVLTGLIVNGRLEGEGGDQDLGLFLNTVPIRAIVGGQNWLDLLSDTFDNETAVIQHRRFPFDRIQAESGLATLCPTVFNYTDFRINERVSPHGVTLRDVRYREETNFEFVVTVDEDPFSTETTVYLTGRAIGLTVAQLELNACFLKQLISHMVTAPHEPVVPSLAAWASSQGHAFVIPPGPRVPAPDTAFALIVEKLRERPGSIAQVHEAGAMSCQELAARVSYVKNGLERLGLKPGSRVACFVDRGPDPLVALLGCWAAGATYVPIDPTLPGQRQRAQLDVAGCAAAIRSMSLEAKGLAWSGPEVAISSDGHASTWSTWATPSASSEAYVLFTSGSTGMPKAVGMPHRAVANLVDWQIRQDEFATVQRVAQYSPTSFDVSILEMVAGAASGTTLIVVPEQSRRDPQSLLDFLADAEVETIFLPTVMLHQMTAAWEAFGRKRMSTLRYVIASGEALVVTDEVRRFFDDAGAELINGYGPTETHAATFHRLGPEPLRWPSKPPIGSPIQNVTLRVLNPLGQPVPRCAPGELYIGGAGIADGYVRSGELDASSSERFVIIDGERYFRTGDIVRDVDGKLEFIGRADNQTKIRGYRVDPDEVAALMMTCPGVRDCAVIPREIGDRRLTLIAYVVRSKDSVGAAALLSHARTMLPEYATPGRIEFLDRIPVTRHGKVDVLALPAPSSADVTPSARETVTAAEQLVLDVFEQVLGHRVSSPTVSFFEAGGTSILLLPLYLRLRTAFGQEMPMRELLRFPAARDIAGALNHVVDGSSIAIVDTGARTEPAQTQDVWLPLTPAQEGMWLDSQLVEFPHVRHLLLALTLRGHFNVPRLSAAWSGVVQAHPALGTRFAVHRGKLGQRLPQPGTEDSELPITLVNAAELASAVDALHRRTLAPADGRSCAVTLLRVSEDYHVLVVTLHHIIGDLRTLQILVDELSARYMEQTPAVQTKPDRYRDAVEAAQDFRNPQPTSLEFWRSRLRSETHMLPWRETPPSVAALKTRWKNLQLDRHAVSQIRRMARIHSVNPPLVLLAAVARALGTLIDRDELYVCMPMSTRDRAEFANTVGLFMENLVIVIDRPDLTATFDDTLARVANRFAESLANMMPFQQVVAVCRPARSGRAIPFAEVSFNYMSQPLQIPRFADLDVSLFTPEYDETRFPLGFYCEESDDELVVRISWHTARLSTDWVERLVAATIDALHRGVLTTA